MILLFNFHDYVYEHLLSSANDRRIKVNLGGELGANYGSIHFEVWDHVWHILPGDDTCLMIDNQEITEHILQIGDVINGVITDTGMPFAIRAVGTDKSYTYFEKYSLEGKNTVTIGGDNNCDIVIADDYVSRQHLTLQRDGSEMLLRDYSTNGTYVRGRRVENTQKLNMMDDIYVAGVKLVYMDDFIAINHIDKRKVLLPIYSPAQEIEPLPSSSSEMLIRSPRVWESLYTEAIELESPPEPQKRNQRPMIFTIGPALTMPLPIMTAFMLRAGEGGFGNPAIIVSVVLAGLLAACWATANVLYERKQTKKLEAHRQEAYKQYIIENDAYMNEKQQENTTVLVGQYLTLSEIASILPHNKAVLWNRNANQPDFLTIRLGVGYVKSQFEIVVPKRKFSLVADDLQKQPHILREKYELIPNSVSILNLREMSSIGVLGTRSSIHKLAGSLALQIAALHCYTDVKMAFLLRPEEELLYDWTRPLPHVRWQENKIRLIAANDNQRQNVLHYLNGVLRTRAEAKDDSNAPLPLPHIVIFCTDPELIRRENLSRYLSEATDCGLTFVLLYEYMDRLPNECSHIIQLDDNYSGYYRLDQSRDKTCSINFDEISDTLLEDLSRQIGGYMVMELATGEIPSSISFLEMYGISSLDEWELNKRWKENRAYESLRALIGISSGGKPLYLDIHEKQHGPHGLIAGTTGSGKSETIQTYILSLVMNFHPTEISLILIDYKGGGMANAFLDLPHLAGTITNLGGSQTNRALLSIKAEIKRRQTLFNQFNVNHIDNYSRYFRDGTATEPMPHLIIISDEFAELKKEQPEFIKELVSTARVGRSLGVHLILATQKPSGVVDDEIWSNSRFKICLRVQDKQDSNEMLHRPEAAFLTNIGRAYMQIGNDEIFELFQSGYSGARYEPEDTAADDGTVTMIALDGSPVVLNQKKKARSMDESREIPTQLSASVQFIHDTAKALGIASARQLWLPELEEGMTLANIRESYFINEEKGLVALLGVIDNPSRQLQYGATVNFSNTGNLLIAGIPGSGKSTLLQTMLYSLAMNYPPEEVNFYVIDCSGSLTKVFIDLPHCGAVIGADDSERISRLFGLTHVMMNERMQMFEKAQVGSYEEYRLASDNVLPKILLVIDNFFAFNDRYSIYVDEQVLPISHACAKYGIHLVVTANHMSDIKFKLRQNFTNTLTLQLAERGDYHDALGVMPQFLPPAGKGRGLWSKETFEYQTVLAVDGDNEQIRAEKIRANFAATGYANYSGFRARPLRSIPKDQIFEDFIKEHGSNNAIAIGYNKDDVSIVSLPLELTYCVAISSSVRKAMESLQQNILKAIAFKDAKLHSVSLKYSPDPTAAFDGIYRNGDDLLNLLLLLRDEFTKRSSIRKAHEQPDSAFATIREQCGLLFVFIDSMDDFLKVIYEEREDNYYPLVEVFFKQGKGLGCYFISRFEPSVYINGSFREAYKLFLSHGCGIHTGGQLDKQKHIEIPLLTREYTQVQEITEGMTLFDEQLISLFVPKNQP
ncbi:MAG: type VII secretion protein EssC [Firmicutes bacterium]|nr:type VII secretion protein EssC [Bacillota bacterium]